MYPLLSHHELSADQVCSPAQLLITHDLGGRSRHIWNDVCWHSCDVVQCAGGGGGEVTPSLYDRVNAGGGGGEL